MWISTNVNYHKGRGDALERGNYCGLKVIDQILKMDERIVKRTTY